MIIKFSDTKVNDDIGNKAKNLILMKNSGVNIPDGFVIFNYTIDIQNNISDILNTDEPISLKSKKIKHLFCDVKINNNIKKEINTIIKNKKYAIRSSSLLEDLEDFSFAGQYESYLNISGLDNICDKIIDCYASAYSENVLNYLLDNNLNFEHIKMAVIVQEMVEANKSGVAFSVNPVNGIDTQMVIEVVDGLGEDLVSGKINPCRYVYDWMKNKIVFSDKNLLSNTQLKTLINQVLKIQTFFGYPCDIEFSFVLDKLYILQSRKITKINYSSYNQQWTTANFKDSGVSAKTCKPFMWSLYEYVWNNKYDYFFTKVSLLKKDDLTKSIKMFYGRPYWNVSVSKKALSKIPGFKEKQFDQELGINAIYKNNGIVTNYNICSVANAVKFLYKFNKIKKFRLKNNQKLKEKILKRYDNYLDKINDPTIDIQKTWYTLVKKHYLYTEGLYFLQIYTNTILQSIFKSNLPKSITNNEYFTLISNLENVSHLLPLYDMWYLSRKIRNDLLAKNFWLKTDIGDILYMYKNNVFLFYIYDLKKYILKYRYHSDKELDVSYKCLIEEPELVIKRLKDMIDDNYNYDPYLNIIKQIRKYKKLKMQIKQRESKFESIMLKTNEFRKMLWWREEFKDLSTRFYYLVRIYTIKYAKYLKDQKILNHIDDIWFLKIFDLINFIDGRLDKKQLQHKIYKNKLYYNSFKNYLSDNDIGIEKNNIITNKNIIKGLGCSNGVVTGVARVINDLSELDRLQSGNILVTKYTDTGWTSKFAILAGLVTENGGILCHSTIICREYGIPCVVGVKNATTLIKDGDTITINAETGEITKKL